MEKRERTRSVIESVSSCFISNVVMGEELRGLLHILFYIPVSFTG